MKMKLAELQEKNDEELLGFAVEEGVVEDGATPRRMEILRKMFKAYSEKDETVDADGILSILNEGYGFLRQNSDERGSGDVYVSQSQIRRFSLRPGDYVVGNVRPPKDGERYFGLVKVGQVNETEPDSSKKRVKFEKLTPIFPEELIVMETEPNQLSTRLIDMMSPVGRGQRGLIVSPPKAGKTTLLKELANGITVNAPDIHIMVALIGERPEEVTDMKRSIKGEVYASTFDEPVEDHIRVAELVLERSKRLVESGEDVVILLDSITRLTRAYNLAVPSSGRTLSGGMDPIALYPPKKFFGAARNTEEGGSLTILAACLVDTGSRMDDVVYEEFKGTGNMEVHLDRKMAERRTFPALDIYKSGTRREELLLSEETLKKVWL
ncbi:MAG: transcription termination factor Rho, partial [SAR202 cluster bacterium]|nr:transcription termination factor Rho [SAR202 cluster bacterium]